jgi:hypothetical protein
VLVGLWVAVSCHVGTRANLTFWYESILVDPATRSRGDTLKSCIHAVLGIS